MTQFRKSKTIGGLRFTAGKRGISTSIGSGPLRVSRGSDGKLRRTVRYAPGVWDTQVLGEDDGKGINVHEARMESIPRRKPRRKFHVGRWLLVLATVFAVLYLIGLTQL